jgi:cysteinyl-tRNA synthetase, unknown class
MNFAKLSILILLSTIISCKAPDGNFSPYGNSYQQEMRVLIQNISKNAKTKKADFKIVTQNGLELLANENTSGPNLNYIYALDGVAVDALNYGYAGVDNINSSEENNYKNNFLKIIPAKTAPIFAIDYCYKESSIKDSYSKNELTKNKIFISNSKILNQIPSVNIGIFNENKSNISKTEDIQNFFVLASNQNYNIKTLVEGLNSTNYDLVVVDPFLNNQILSNIDVNAIKIKKNGAKRLVYAIINVSEADSKKYYWQNDWKLKLPSFADKEIGILGNFRAKYWQTDWQNVLYGNENSLTNTIIKAGFDGCYLIGVEGYQWYE